ncbi:MAG: hypothetical protein HYX41_06290 [Bdellovibrio sp.]|nr:hypothetical protein [Bdellovibrio sp.]
MQKFKFDREKYLNIFRTQGVGVALTALQKDTERWEYEAFEGRAGYNPEMWEELEKVRDFSRELWDKHLHS